MRKSAGWVSTCEKNRIIREYRDTFAMLAGLVWNVQFRCYVRPHMNLHRTVEGMIVRWRDPITSKPAEDRIDDVQYDGCFPKKGSRMHYKLKNRGHVLFLTDIPYPKDV